MQMLEGLALQDNGIPIYVQLRDQIAAAVGRGELAPGTQIPTMRQVAVMLKIDLNTVQRAYAELERAGLLTKMRGRGTFVAEAPPKRDRRTEVRAFAARVAALARARGIALEEVLRALESLRDRGP